MVRNQFWGGLNLPANLAKAVADTRSRAGDGSTISDSNGSGTVRIAASASKMAPSRQGAGYPSAVLVDGRHGNAEMDRNTEPAAFGDKILDERAVALRDSPLLTFSPGHPTERGSAHPRGHHDPSQHGVRCARCR